VVTLDEVGDESAAASSRVLVIFPGALGDLICAGPALEAIARANPAAAIELMAKAELARFAVGRFPVARGHSIDRSEVAALFTTDDRGAREFFSQFSRLYSYFGYDDIRFRTSLEGLAPHRVVFFPFRPAGVGHVSLGYLKMLEPQAIEASFNVEVLAEDSSAADAALETAGIRPGAGLVAIFPGSGSRTKNWPIANYLGLAAAMRESMQPVFILGPVEAEIERQVRRSGFPVLSGLELEVVAAIARRSAAFVGNDSGVSHLAAAAGAKGVAIFGPTSPDRWRPIGDVAIIAGASLDSITVGEVASALKRVLIGAASTTMSKPKGSR
jgi:heptosyltransferase III